ncbi:MAG: S49 family peptidase [Burkholderiaceae bacterium]
MTEPTEKATIEVQATQPTGWERSVIEKLVAGQLKEARDARRWAMARRVITLAFFVWLVVFLTEEPWRGHGGAETLAEHTAVVSVLGVIEPDGDVDAFSVNDALREAFETREAKGIILRINSPGGSPVQSALIFDEIRRLKALNPDKQVLAVIEDVGASGAYYIAAAADSIYVSQASLVGSIGVRMDSFGFTELLKKVGIERRLMTAGENKALNDPFLPEDPKAKKIIQDMLNEVHQQFISAVKAGRGDRLKGGDEVFSGMVFSGARSIELGLADGLGSLEGVARDVIKVSKLVDYSYEPSWPERLAREFGAGAGASAIKLLRDEAAVPSLAR